MRWCAQRSRGGSRPLRPRGSRQGARAVHLFASTHRHRTTSACSFAIPAPYDKFKVNVFIVSGGKKLVCPRADGGSCDGAGGPGGWFWAGEKIALCDASCIEFGDGAGQLVAEVGCPRLTCK